MIKTLNIISIAFLGIITIACTSLVYSPSINLPDKIRKDETKIVAAYESLPSTSNSIDKGMIVALQHSYSDNICMQLKYWTDFDSYGSEKDYLHGASITSYISLNDTNSPYKFYLAPTIGMSLNENRIQMGTIGSWLAVQTPSFYFFEPYAAIGFIYANTNVKSKVAYGFGIMSNLGTHIKLYKNLRLNIEYSFPIKIDMYFKTGTLFVTPTIGFSYGGGY